MVIKDSVTVWENCLEHIRANVTEQSFKTWFEPIKPVRLDNQVLTIQVPNQFFYEWLEEHYLGLLKKTIKSELGDKGRLEYQILLDPVSSSKSSEVEPVEMISAEQIQNPFVIPGIKKLKIDPQLNDHYTFNSFVEGDCNRLARSAGKAISDRPGNTSFNPLVIFGDVGLGKTHLAQAIGNEITQKHPKKSVLYVTTEKFTNQIIQAIKNNSVNDFVNFYQMIDVLIVDDIQFLANRTKTQEIFFHIFNQLHQNRKQIVLTSDRPPKDLDGMEERLISRFKWGLSTDLQPPDLETRIAILEVKMQAEGIEMPRKVIEFICYNITTNIRELEGVLISLVAHASLSDKEITIDLAKEVIQNFVERSNQEVNVESIQELVADFYDISVDRIKSKTRKREIVTARQLAMYLAKNHTKEPLKTIGLKFGGRDHSTVIYSLRAVQDQIDTDKAFKKIVRDLEKKIKMQI